MIKCIPNLLEVLAKNAFPLNCFQKLPYTGSPFSHVSIAALNVRAMKYSDASLAVMKPDEPVLRTHLRSCHEGIQCPIYCS